MKKRVLIEAPIFTRSGYGEHARFLYRSLKDREDLDLYIVPLAWGGTGWLWKDNEERKEIDNLVQKMATRDPNQQFDIHVHVGIPEEFKKKAPIGICVTAGIETDRVSKEWIMKTYEMDKIIVPSEFSKQGFVNSKYKVPHPQTGQEMEISCNCPVEVCHYPVRVFEPEDIGLELDYDFNYLSIVQWGPRKNVEQLIVGFIEENYDKEVGLVLKMSTRNDSLMDREYTYDRLQGFVKKISERYEDKKCKIYLIHGDMTEEELSGLYQHPKIKAYITTTHGEGFGLPLFEASYYGLPIMAPYWSGHVDFLIAPETRRDKKKNKTITKEKPLINRIDYTMGPIGKEAYFRTTLVEGMNWCFPDMGSYKKNLREMEKNYNSWKKKAKTLQEYNLEKFEESKMMKRFSENVVEERRETPVSELPKVSIVTSVFDGGECFEGFMEDITRQTVFSGCELVLVHPKESPSWEEEEKIIQRYQEKYDNIINVVPEEPDNGVYWAWNLGIENSTGEYITNANIDDRKRIDSIERHAMELSSDDGVSLVYSDSYITSKLNETFEVNSSEGNRYNFEKSSKESLLRGNQPHNNPMWRRSLHEKYGYFDDKYKSAGDWDFHLRCVFGGEKFGKIEDVLGLYCFSPKGLSTNPENFGWKRKEEEEIFLKYRGRYDEKDNIV